ncbi:hypothetical protein ACWDSF_21060 [Nocardia beijingensis]|uniref:hypothetical protein n=1 Tax=Nocardia beijingensis TaxID=95162 RepID=UPI0018948B4B|nr:hypothetical protein [Nocardia beijingensis]MBF6079622.1 hypothetical protein [Nocardia beijingensis]
MIALGFIVAIGLPLVVLALAILWPERIPKDHTVDAIRQRIEGEDRSQNQP